MQTQAAIQNCMFHDATDWQCHVDLDRKRVSKAL